MQKQHTKNNNYIKTEIDNLKREDMSDCELCAREDNSNFELDSILEKCELEIFSDEMKEFFKTIITRLYYSENLKVGKSLLPRTEIIKLLYKIRGDHLIELSTRIKDNDTNVTRPIEFVCSVLINILSEGIGSVVLSLPKNCVSTEMLYSIGG